MNYQLFQIPDDEKINYPVLILDSKGFPVLPLMVLYKQLKTWNSKNTALTYVKALMLFFSWLDTESNYQGKKVRWHGVPEAIREATKVYLANRLGCKITRDRNGEERLLVRQGDISEDSSITESSARVILSSIKAFYNIMIDCGVYSYDNPLRSQTYSNMQLARRAIEREFLGRNRLPDVAGTDSKHNRRETSNYFVVVDGEWTPQILDDPAFKKVILQAGKEVGWSIRDTIIARMLFEGGSRASEVILLTIGDIDLERKRARTFSKGSNGKKTKFITFLDETVTLLRRYLKQERQQWDNQRTPYMDLAKDSPLFLTKDGDPYNYSAFHKNWRKACKMAGVNANIHKIRHWYVTQAIRRIMEESNSTVEMENAKQRLITYMAWKDPSTIEVYEHFYEAETHAENMLKYLEELDRQTITIKKSNRKERFYPKPLKNSTNVTENDHKKFIDDLFG
ncbi:tyrosine-type recombinase/integrase [Brevibacillus brevis]|uniref:tyrosine-type recombinase/integrase n=1 Tax=Brevibacillus brevis TaxID=1393 RepID=UPI0007D8A602|nr:site-specific integrase [Brevibacillus brevis]